MNLTVAISNFSSSDSMVLSPGSPKASVRRISWSPEPNADTFHSSSSESLPRNPSERFWSISPASLISKSRSYSDSSMVTSSPCVFDCDLLSFNTYIIHLFKTALDNNKKAVNELLQHPLFKDRIFEIFTEEKIKTNRIDILHYLAFYHIDGLEKQDVKDLIRAVGTSTYVSSTKPRKIKFLYANLFAYRLWPVEKEPMDFEITSSLETGSLESKVYPRNIVTPSSVSEFFSKEELLELESQANKDLRPYITAHIEKRFHKTLSTL